MTAKELREKLADYPDTIPVVVNLGRNELANGREIGTVEVVQVYRLDREGRWHEDYYPGVNGDGTYERATILNLRP